METTAAVQCIARLGLGLGGREAALFGGVDRQPCLTFGASLSLFLSFLKCFGQVSLFKLYVLLTVDVGLGLLTQKAMIFSESCKGCPQDPLIEHT